MNTFSYPKKRFSRPLFRLCQTLACLFSACALLLLPACKKQSADYFSYVSELRSNILLAEAEGYTLRVYATTKEYPYTPDGVPREKTTRAEAYLIAPSGDKDCSLSFSWQGNPYGGDMSFDNVKTEYYYSCTLDLSNAKTLVCEITHGEKSLRMEAKSVLETDTLPAEKALKALVKAENALFKNMTDKYGFTGEIYVRLIHEDAPYYYVGVIDRKGKTTAFLLNASSGKILARRES